MNVSCYNRNKSDMCYAFISVNKRILSMLCDKINMYKVTWSNVKRMIKGIHVELKMSKE